MGILERSASEWHAEAARCYIEGHQACAWCGQAHQVYRIETGSSLVFRCNACDFQVSHDKDLDRFAVIPGESVIGQKKLETMLDLH